jgi:hypothetical protein
MIRNAAVTHHHRSFAPVLDPDFDDDDGWVPVLGEPQLHPDYWGAHDYAGVISADQFPCAGLSLPYRRWREINRQRRPALAEEPQLHPDYWGWLDWHTPEVIEVRKPEPEPEPEPEYEIRPHCWPRNGAMPVLRADEDYEYLRVRYGQRFWAVIFGYLNGRIERWFRDDLDRIKRCIAVDHD